MAWKYNDNKGLYKNYTKANKTYLDYANNPEKYGYNKYSSQIEELFNQIMNAPEFSYDMNKDQLFQMYKQQYTNQGNAAMKNQMGISAANSGGYNSSAAQTSAQNTYQTYMDALSEKAADTYQNAYSMYNTKQEKKNTQLNDLIALNNSGNDAYWAQRNATLEDRNSAYDTYWNDRTAQYNQYADGRNYKLQRKKYNGK